MWPENMSPELRKRVEDAAIEQGVSSDEMLDAFVRDYFARLEELKELIGEADLDFAQGRFFSAEQVRERMAQYADQKKKSSA